MRLAKLLKCLEYEIIQGTKEIEITKVVKHSREATPGALFVCITGTLVDGRMYTGEALERGAVAVVVEKEVEVPQGVTVVRVEYARKALAKIAAAFYDYPAMELRMIGVTGTKGKTTTTYMIHDILECAGHKAGLVGTIEINTGKRRISAEHTSPESLEVQGYLREMVNAGCDMAVMEVSSQGLKLNRVDEIPFEVGVFTNLGVDHIGIGEHTDFEEYKECKARLFKRCKIGIANRDDPHWREMFCESRCEVQTIGFTKEADYRLSDDKLTKENGELGISYRVDGEEYGTVDVSMPGKFNVYNSALALAVCRYFEVPMGMIQKGLKQVQVRGRVEKVEISDQFTFIIDYAHNAMSLQSILEMVHSYNPNRIVCVFGCGGNRAKDRRYEMGRVSGELADLTIITSDNPRYEEPLTIMNDIKTGIEKTSGKYIEICDRKEAIRYAICHAGRGDVVILAGKGHEDYQEIKGVKYHMDDRELIREIIPMGHSIMRTDMI